MELVSGDALPHYGASVTDELREPGEQIDGFEISKCLAVTLLGALYRVHVRPAGGVRLLHVLPSGLTRDPKFRGRLEKRVHALSRMNSEAVMAPQEVVDFDRTLAILYDDHTGESLSTLRTQESKKVPKSPAEVRTLLKQLLLSIEVASGVGAHHFALTPDFVFLGSGGSVKLWGFGVMEILDRRQFEIFISSAIIPLKEGEDDPDYTVIEALSPEWRNEESVDVRADLYGLGILAFNLLTARRYSPEVPKPSMVREGVGTGWDYFVRRLIEHDPQDRYQTSVAVSTDIERVERLGGADGADDAGGAFGRLHLPGSVSRRLSVRTRTLIEVLGFVLFVVLAVTAYISFRPAIIETETTGAEIVLAGEEPPNLILTISPERARVRFLGDREFVYITTTGRLEMRGEPREYEVVVEARGYDDASLRLTLGDRPVERLVDLELSAAKLRLRAPGGSRLDVRGADGSIGFLEMVPSDGVLEIEDRLLAREYDLIVSHPLYHPLEFLGLDLPAGDWVELKAHLDPYKVPLEVRSKPVGAAVRVNGVVVGSTPLVIADVPVHEPVDLFVGGGELRTWQGQVQPKVEGANIVDVGHLEATHGTLQLRLNFGGQPPQPGDLEAFSMRIGDDLFRGAEALNVGVPAGRHDLRVEHPDYLAKIGSVSLEDRETTVLEIDLRPRPATLAIEAPGRRQVFTIIDGQRRRLDNGRMLLEPSREVTVRLEALDYLPVERTFTLRPNSKTVWEPDWETLPGPQSASDWTLPRLDFDIVWAPPGAFQMGSPLTEAMRYPNEGPVTAMRLKEGFWISATEVTQSLYEAIMGENPSHYYGPDRPVDSVTWHQANEFCQRLTARERETGRLPTGHVYRLPTEAEWEYAARAGVSTAFHFGNRAKGGEEHFQGRYPRDYLNPETMVADAGSIPVAQSAPNRWGLFDVHGNVREWTLDAYNDRLPGGEQTDYRRTGEGRGRPVRGGSWSDLADRCRFAARESVASEIKRPFLGFRIVLAPYR